MRFLAILAFTACIGDSSDLKPTPEPSPTKTITPVAPPKPDCEWVRYRIEREVRSAYVAMDRHTYYQRARKMVPAVSADCRSGWWHLAVARLLDTELPANRAGFGFASPEAALAAALQQPDDVEVLERVALVATLGRELKLPVDACKRAQAAARNSPDYRRERDEDSARYVCARMAIGEGNGAAANAALDAITEPTWFADVELARADAAKLLGDRAATIRHARLAIRHAKQVGMRITSRDRDAIVRLAEALAR